MRRLRMETYTVTFSECVENHVGMQKIGSIAPNGYTNEHLMRIHQSELNTELYDLAQMLPENQQAGNTAYVLVIRGGVQALGADPNALLKELQGIPHDSTMYSGRHGGVVNKIARHNICIADLDQQSDIANGKGTVVSYARLPEMSKLRAGLTFVGANNMYAETNHYYNVNKCGIGYHGDTERKIVIGARLGAIMPLTFKWYHHSKAVTAPIIIHLAHNDMYIMSEKAAGSDWKRPSILTLRHAAGCSKYTGV